MKPLFFSPRILLAVVGLVFFPALLPAQTDDKAWSVSVLDGILAAVPPGQNVAQVSDMEIPVTVLKAWRDDLAGVPRPKFAVGTNVTLWPGGNVYYTFDPSVTAANQKAFVDAVAEWTAFANVHFMPRTTQPNYMLVMQNNSLGGGLSAVGMVGPAQTYQIGPTAWNHRTLVHEAGHTLGLVHEHQRSDRTNFVNIISNNITPGQEGNFTLLTTSQNHGAYDFLSIMHYAHNAFATSTNLDTMVPLPAFSQYYALMGNADPILSQSDRTNMAVIYGAPLVTPSSVVNNTQDSGPGSLRTAMYYGFDHPGTTITFNIPTNDPGFSNNVFNIQPDDQLPGLFNATTINGASEPVQSNAPGPAIVLSGAQTQTTSVFADGLRLAGTNCVVKSLVINGFSQYGVLFDGTNSTGNSLQGCYVGTDPTGNSAVTNRLYNVYLAGGAHSNTIGGLTPAARNVISGSSSHGIILQNAGTYGNVISGNYIGLNAAGTAALPNTGVGIGFFGSPQSNLVGGTVSGARNVISGNGNQGVYFQDPGTTGNVVAGNYIGVDFNGTNAVPNGYSGVAFFSSANFNVVGGTVPGAGNVISGNANQGIYLSGVNGNVVAGNWIGLASTGTNAVPNTWAGIEVGGGAQSNLFGGPLPAMRNVISGNSIQGIFLHDPTTSANNIQGNYIGLNALGTAAVPNLASGMEIQNVTGNVVGGGAGLRNVISGNAHYGIQIESSSTGVVVTGNTIGLNISSSPVPNSQGGMAIFNAAASNQIGGITPGAANLIAGHAVFGVFVTGAGTVGNSIRGNSLFNNGSFGIANQSGGNNGQAGPSLSSAVLTTNTTIIGSLTSAATTLYHLDFYASAPPSGSAEGTVYVGSQDVTTSGGGTAAFTNVAGIIPIGQIITATATDPNGNTSQLAGFAPVTGTSGPNDGIPNAWRIAYFGGSGNNTNSTNCALCDADGDGMNNRQEFLAGTNPTNAASVLKITSVAPSGTNVNVNFQSVAGITYRVESRDDAVIGGWSLLGDQILGTGGVMQVTDPGAAALTKRFYRVDVDH